MKIKSYSKINLFLLVSNNKKNNLHKIKSIILLNKDLYDEIEIKKNNFLKIEYYKNDKKINIENCNVLKILLFIKNFYNVDINYEIKINKKIPIGSGVGGSSSNAAYIAKYILESNAINYKNNYDNFIDIGSDIPFFLSGFDCAYVYEFGNKIKEKIVKNIKYKIEFYSNEISTKELYDQFDNNRKFNIFRNYYIQLFFLKFKLYKYLINDIQKNKIYFL